MSISIPNYVENRPAAPVSPMQIMQAAAEKLPESTGKQIFGKVFTINPGGSNLFRYTFYLFAPALNDYTDPLFYAWHQVQPYPIRVLSAGGENGREEKTCNTPDEFEKTLSEIFASESTKERIYVILDAVSVPLSAGSVYDE